MKFQDLFLQFNRVAKNRGESVWFSIHSKNYYHHDVRIAFVSRQILEVLIKSEQIHGIPLMLSTHIPGLYPPLLPRVKKQGGGGIIKIGFSCFGSPLPNLEGKKTGGITQGYRLIGV